MSIYQSLVLVHVVSGTVALVCFWIAGLARKGSNVHRRAGRYYLYAMLGVLLSALPMTALILRGGRIGFGIFFAFLVLITATSVWLAWRAIRFKRNAAAFYSGSHKVLALTNVVVGLVVFAVGVSRGGPLLMGFSWVGVLIGVSMLRRHGLAHRPANWWLREHYGAMIGNGVATHISFLGIAMRDIPAALALPWLANYSFLAWILPLVVAALVAIRLDRRYAAPTLHPRKGLN